MKRPSLFFNWSSVCRFATIPVIVSGQILCGSALGAEISAQVRYELINGIGFSKALPSLRKGGRLRGLTMAHRKPDSPRVIDVIEEVGNYPRSINVSEKLNKIFAISPYDGYVTIVDGETNTVEDSVFTDTDPNYAVIDDDNDRLYVLSDGSSRIITMDTRTHRIIGQPIRIGRPHKPKGCNNFDIPCTDPGSDSYTITMNHKTGRIYVGNIADRTVSVVDVKKGKVIKTIPIKASAYLLKVNERTNKVYVVTGFFAAMVVIDGETNRVIKSIPIGFPGIPADCYQSFECEEWGSYSFNLSINEKTNTIYAANFFSGDMVVVDGRTDRPTASPVKIGRTANFLAVDEAADLVYVGNMDDASLTLVDGKSRRIVGSPLVLGEPAGPPGCVLFDCTDYSTTLVEIAINRRTKRVYVLDELERGVITVIDGNIENPGLPPITHKPLRIPLHDLGLFQLVIHDIYNVERGGRRNFEDGRLNLSTVLDHGDENIGRGGEFRNLENPATFTLAQRYGRHYLSLIRGGKSKVQARRLVLERYLADVKSSYERVFDVPFPHPSSSDDSSDLTGNLAFRTMHDLIPGRIKVNGVEMSMLDPSLAGRTLNSRDLWQLSARLDRHYDAELREMQNPMNGEHIDLLERDFSFAREFDTDYSFGELLSGQRDGDYDSFDLSSILMWKALSSAQRPLKGSH